VEPVDSGAEEAAAPGYIPIDIGNAVPAEHKYEYLSVRAEGIPRGAVLSSGQNNGDETWSLTPEDLAGLVYIPSKREMEPHLICFRIVGVRGGFGEAIGSVDVNIESSAVIPGTYNAPTAAESAEGYVGMAARFQSEVDSEVSRRIALEKAAWEKDGQPNQTVIAEPAKVETGSDANAIAAAQAAELADLVADAERRVETAEAAARTANDALYEAVARAEAAESSIGMNEEAEALRAQLMAVRRELSGVKASMRVRSGNREEVEKEIREALDDEFAQQTEELHERYGQELERLTKLVAASEGTTDARDGGGDGAGDAGDFEARLAEARQQWEQDIAAKLASVESATKKAIMQGREAAVAEARQQWDQEFQEKLAAAQADAEPDQQQIDAAVQQAIAAREQEWKADLDRRVGEARVGLQAELEAARAQADSRVDEDEVARRIEAARQELQAELQAAQAQADNHVDEDEVTRRIEAAQEEWQAAQNQYIEARDLEWQTELDRRVEDERTAAAAVAASGLADGDPDAEQHLADAQEEWAQTHTMEIERRLLEAEEAWQAKDEERLQAAKVGWEAELQVLIAERDEQWKLEMVRQLDEAKQAWRTGVDDHTPALEMPVVVAPEDAPVGVAPEAAVTEAVAAAETVVEGASDSGGAGEAPAVFEEALGQEVVLDGELPAFFEDHDAETAPDREWPAEPVQPEIAAVASQAKDNEAPDSIPEWMEVWGDRLRIPRHHLPAIHRFGRGVSWFARGILRFLRGAFRFVRFVVTKIGQFWSSRKAAAPQPDPAQAAAVPGAMAQAAAPAKGFGLSRMSLATLRHSKPVRALLGFVRAILEFVWSIFALLLRFAVTAGVFVGLYHGYQYAKPYAEPYVKPYVATYWDPYVGPYVTTYWDPYVQTHIDKYWGSYAKPYIVRSWDNNVQPTIDASWAAAKSFVGESWEDSKEFAADSAQPPRVGASVSKGAAKAKATASSKPKPSPVAPRVYLRPVAANIRVGPSKYAALVGTARQEEHIQRLEQNGGWTKIRVVTEKMKVGWIHDSLLSDQPTR
jgi:hypothetical protein